MLRVGRVAILLGLASCALFADLEGFSNGDGASGRVDGGDGSGSGDGDAPSADAAAPTSDAGSTADGVAPTDPDASPGPTCKGAGATAVRVGGYCVDSVEVTGEQYAKFLAAKAGDTSGQPAECAWNTSFQPLQNPTPNAPVFGLDWCDALAYCTWAGKRLCGRIGGGAVDPTLRANAAADEWFRACSADATRTYPYGSTHDPSACNLPAYGAGKPVDVGTLPRCVGGYDGLFDMIGNLWEWENSCVTEDGGMVCSVRGGSYAAQTDGKCAQVRTEPATNRSDITARCCSD